SFADEVYISAVSCSCLTRSSNSVARARLGGMGFPQLGFPRFRVAGSAIVIVIRLVQQEVSKASVLMQQDFCSWSFPQVPARYEIRHRGCGVPRLNRLANRRYRAWQLVLWL